MTSTTPTTPTTNSRSESGRHQGRVALRRATVAALVAIGAIASTGCDNADSRAAREALQDAAIARSVADPVKAAQGVEAKLGTLAPADAAQLAQAKSFLAGARLAGVRAKLPELQSAEAEVVASLGAIDATVAIAAGAAGDATTLALRDPASTIAQVQSVAANTRGDGNAPLALSADLVDANGKSVKVEIPSQSAVTLRISELNGAIARATDQIKAMNDELAKHNVAAGEAALAAESGKTADERLGKLQEAMNHRIEAATRSQEIANAQAALDQLKAQLAAAENQKASLDASVQALESRLEALKASSKAVTTAVADRRKAAGALLTADALDPVDKVTERKPSEVIAKADELRKSILEEYDAVVKAYEEAATAGGNVAAAYPSATDSSIPESATWQAIIESVSVPRYKLSAASVKLDIANVHFAHALLLAKQNEIAKSLAEVFGKGGLSGSAPATLNVDETAKGLAEAIGAANTAFGEASALVDVAMGNTASKPTRNAATVLKPYVLYGQSQVAALAERAGVKLAASEGAEKPQGSKDLLTAAKEAAKEAIQQNLNVGHLPSEFADVMPKKDAAPDAAGATGDASGTAAGATNGTGEASANPTAAAGADTPEVAALRTEVQKVQSDSIDLLIAGKVDELRATLLVEPGAEADAETIIAFATQSSRFLKLAAEKFPMMNAVMLGQIRGAARVDGKLTVNEDSTQVIEASTKYPGRTSVYRKVDGVWKSVVQASPSEADKASFTEMTKVGDVFKTLSDEIEGGQITAPEQLAARMQELMTAAGVQPPAATPGDAAPQPAPSGETPPAAP